MINKKKLKNLLRWTLICSISILLGMLTFLVTTEIFKIYNTNKILNLQNSRLDKINKELAEEIIVLEFEKMKLKLELKECNMDKTAYEFYLKICVDEMETLDDNNNDSPFTVEGEKNKIEKGFVF